MNLCIQLSDFPPRFPGALGNRNEFCRFVKSITTKQKHEYHPLQHKPAFPDDGDALIQSLSNFILGF